MTSWQYHRVMVAVDVWGSTKDEDDEALALYAKEGWEPYAVSTFRDFDGKEYETHHFRRPTPNESDAKEGP